MWTEHANVKTTAAGALQQRHDLDLLAAWLAALNRLDNPMRRRAAKYRQGGSLQIAPQQIRQASATISPIFHRANLVRLV
jgi:hypothetical protein